MADRHRAKGLLRGRPVALLIVGVFVGSTLITPVGAHVGGTVGHLWKEHIRPLTDTRYYTKKQANNRYFTKAQASNRFGAGILGGEWKNLFSSGSSSRAPAGLSTGPEIVRWLAPVPIVLTDFHALVTQAPGSGQTRTLGISVFDPSGSFVDSLSCTVSGTSTACNSGAKKVTIPAGGFFSGSESGSSSASAANGRFGYRALTP